MILAWLLDLKFVYEPAARMDELQIRHTSKSMILVRLLNLKFLSEIAAHCRNFKFAALVCPTTPVGGAPGIGALAEGIAETLMSPRQGEPWPQGERARRRTGTRLTTDREGDSNG